jgi:hypothetical protein
MLNFAGVTYSNPPTCSVSAGTSSADEIITRGMWHQYGSIPRGSNLGVFATITDGSPASGSLADIVGFPTGKPMRVGKLKKELKLEEAVVAIPFKTVANRRQFFELSGDLLQNFETYENIKSAMAKYVFPPKFDFTRFETVNSVLMYVFEFSVDLDQQDLADMWQNLPPDIGEKFEQKEVIIEDKRLLNMIANNTEDIQWMVFKVKKRAAKDYEKFRRGLVTDETSAISSKIGEYSYNWPYDYFSLVELIKIDEGIQYISSDVVALPSARMRRTPTASEEEASSASRSSTAPLLKNLPTTDASTKRSAKLGAGRTKKSSKTVSSRTKKSSKTIIKKSNKGGRK